MHSPTGSLDHSWSGITVCSCQAPQSASESPAMGFSGIYCTEMQKISLPLGLVSAFAHRAVCTGWVCSTAHGAQSFSYLHQDFCLQDTHAFNSFYQQSPQLGSFRMLLEQGPSATLRQLTQPGLICADYALTPDFPMETNITAVQDFYSAL